MYMKVTMFMTVITYTILIVLQKIEALMNKRNTRKHFLFVHTHFEVAA